MKQRKTKIHRKSARANTECEYQWFGIELIDRLLEQTPISPSMDARDRVLVSLGESGTLKRRLAFAFLAAAFRTKQKDPNLRPDWRAGAILLTSERIEKGHLLAAFREWDIDIANLKNQVLVHTILPRFLSSSNFVFRLKLCIRHMKRELAKSVGAKLTAVDATHVRVVIDNWNSIVDSHAPLKRDPQLLQSVFSLLRREGVLAYLVGTQPGSPQDVSSTLRIHDLGQLEAPRIHTWPVDFFGDRRIAITTSLPGTEEHRTAIYELAREDKMQYKIRLKPDFDIYEDLESGKAKRVDLRVKLYSGHHSDSSPPPFSAATYNNEVSALFGDLFPSSRNDRGVISFENIERYDAFKEYIQNLEASQLSDTLVFQVDEFWTGEKSSALADLSYFRDLRAAYRNGRAWPQGDFPQSDYRIPLHKDFGLLLADRSAWFRAKDLSVGAYRLQMGDVYLVPTNELGGIDIPSMLAPVDRSLQKQIKSITVQWTGSPGRHLTVADVWNSLCIDGDEFDVNVKIQLDAERSRPPQVRTLLKPSWELFLLACRTVAMRCGKSSFDVDLRTSESLSSLILEIWFTKIKDRILSAEYPAPKKGNDEPIDTETVLSYADPKTQMDDATKEGSTSSTATNDFHAKKWDQMVSGEVPLSLGEMVTTWENELDYSVRLVVGCLPGRYREYDLKLAHADLDVVALRTWFAPAVLCQVTNRDLSPLRLPGRHSVRGDWYLGVAKGSRSLLLAANAIDKLVSESMNRKRLRDGIGLPVHDINGQVDSALTIPESETSSHRRVQHYEILKIEPVNLQKYKPTSTDLEPPLVQLFRSRIRHYDRDSGEFFLMIAALLRNVTPLTDQNIALGLDEHEIEESAIKIFQQFKETNSRKTPNA